MSTKHLLLPLAAVGLLTCHFLTADERTSTKADSPSAKKTGDELSAARFDKLLALIKPHPKQSFESVPWQTSLWAARQQAAAEDKPLVLWAGDPLPLGVT